MAMTNEQRARLEAMSMVGRQVCFKNKGAADKKLMGVVEDEVYTMVSDYKHMIQRIRLADGVSWDESQCAYRTGYYTYEFGMKNIKWGQYTQFLTESEYRDLLAKARDKGWPIFE